MTDSASTTAASTGAELNRRSRFPPGDGQTIALVGAALGAFNVTAALVLAWSGHPITRVPVSGARMLMSVFFGVLLVVCLAAMQTTRRTVTVGSAFWAWLVPVSGAIVVYLGDHNIARAAVLFVGSAGASVWLFVRRRQARG